MNNDDFKEVPDNIQDNNEETTNNIDNTNDNKSKRLRGCLLHLPQTGERGRQDDTYPAEPVHLQRLYAKDL